MTPSTRLLDLEDAQPAGQYFLTDLGSEVIRGSNIVAACHKIVVIRTLI
jgi:hypothetical protein